MLTNASASGLERATRPHCPWAAQEINYFIILYFLPPKKKRIKNKNKKKEEKKKGSHLKVAGLCKKRTFGKFGKLFGAWKNGV